jgi:hypothetical protein
LLINRRTISERPVKNCPVSNGTNSKAQFRVLAA